MLRVKPLTQFFDEHLVSVLYIFGCWPKSNQSYSKLILYYLQIFIGVSYLFGAYVSTFLVEDPYIRSNLASLSILATVFVIRVFNFNRSWKGVQNCLSQLQNFKLYDTDEIKDKMPMLTILSTIFLFSHYFYVLSVSIMPVFSSERVLPQNMVSFPLNWRQNIFFYILAYIYGILGMVVLVSMNALTSIYVCYVMLMVSLQVGILAKRIERVGYNCRNCQESSNTLLDCFKLHRDLDAQILKIGNYFAFSFLGEIALGGLTICAGAFSLSQVPIAEHPLRFLNYSYELSISVIHILMPLYFGNEMYIKMDNLSLAVYGSNWPDQTYQFRRIAITFLENLKKPRLILVGYVIPWNLETFTSILKLGYTLFNVLQSLKNKQNF